MHYFSKETAAPSDFKATDPGTTEVTLKWKEPQITTEKGLDYKVNSIKVFSIPEFIRSHLLYFPFLWQIFFLRHI